MITDHASVLVCHMAPDRQGMMNALLAMFQHGFGDIRVDLSVDDIEQGM